MFRCVIFRSWTGLISIASVCAAPLADPTVWDQVAFGLVREAHETFADSPANDREVRFGEAITLLNLQPKTESNLDRAETLLSAIGGKDDFLGISARYYLARIAQVHRATPKPETALRFYRALAATPSRHPLAERAVVQLALIELFERGITPPERHARFDRLVTHGAALTDRSAIRDLNLVLGDVALRFDLGESRALKHLLAADEAGLARPVTQRDTWVRIGELARRTGRNDVAIAYYRRFLDTFRRDSRNIMIRERLDALLKANDSTSEEAGK